MRYPDFILLIHSCIRALQRYKYTCIECVDIEYLHSNFSYRLWQAEYGVENSEEVAVSLANTAFQKVCGTYNPVSP